MEVNNDVVAPENDQEDTTSATETENEYYWNTAEKRMWMFTLFCGNFLLYAARSVMSISIPAMSNELGWNTVVSGTALSAFFGGYLCTNMMGGYFADQYGGEIVICYAGIGWASLTTFLPFIARSSFSIISPTYGVILARFATGLSQGVFYPSMSAVTSKRIRPAEKGLFTGLTNSGASIGSALTGLLGSTILEMFDWGVAFIIIGSLAILWILWVRYLISFERVISKKTNTVVKTPLSFLKLVSSGPFWGLFIAYSSGSYVFINLLSWTPVYFHDSFPQSKGWLFNTIPWLVAFLMANIVGYTGVIMSTSGFSVTSIRRIFCSLQLLGMCLTSLSINFVHSFNEALFIMSLNIASNTFNSCGLSLNAQDLAPSKAGMLFRFMNGSGAVAGLIGTYLTGLILKRFANWSVVFYVNSILTFIGWVVFMCLGSGEPIR